MLNGGFFTEFDKNIHFDLKIEVGNIKMQSDAMYNSAGDFTSENQTQNLDAKVKRIESLLVERLPDQFARVLNPDSPNA